MKVTTSYQRFTCTDDSPRAQLQECSTPARQGATVTHTNGRLCVSTNGKWEEDTSILQENLPTWIKMKTQSQEKERCLPCLQLLQSSQLKEQGVYGQKLLFPHWYESSELEHKQSMFYVRGGGRTRIELSPFKNRQWQGFLQRECHGILPPPAQRRENDTTSFVRPYNTIPTKVH